ncbi:MAG: hypothetical protein HYR63_15275 [Proteobacteria bacterium]|nr:hypothetical protein [Pseudomonadota bacterium]
MHAIRPHPLRILALLWALTAAGPAAAADGLGRFESAIKPKLTGLSYGSGSALGPAGFALSDVRIVVPGDKPGVRPTTVQAKRVVVEDIDFDHTGDTDFPHFLKLRVEAASADGEAGDWLGRYGFRGLASDLVLDYRFDAARKVFTLNRLELALPGLARIEASLVLDGVSTALANQPDSAKDDIQLRTATLVYDDASLFAKLVTAMAAEEKKSPADLLGDARTLIAAFAQGQGPATLAIFDALASYLADYQHPQGALRASVNPKSNLTAKDWDKLGIANAIVDVFGLGVSYAGTRPGTALASAGAAAKTPTPGAVRSAPAPGAGAGAGAVAKLGCSPGERYFVLFEGGYWPGTAREGTAESGRCVFRLEGSDRDDDVVVGRDRMLAWSIDGPGLPASSCRKGERVWAKSEGAWYPALVKDTPKPGAPCTLRYENDDGEDEKVELRRVRVIR